MPDLHVNQLLIIILCGVTGTLAALVGFIGSRMIARLDTLADWQMQTTTKIESLSLRVRALERATRAAGSDHFAE